MPCHAMSCHVMSLHYPENCYTNYPMSRRLSVRDARCSVVEMIPSMSVGYVRPRTDSSAQFLKVPH
jgi:hypothetical protein